MAAYSALQGWHPMQYAYWATTETAPAMINAFEGMFDPAQSNMLPAAALLFLRGDVRESADAYYEPITRDQAFNPLAQVPVHPAASLVLKYGVAFTDLPQRIREPLRQVWVDGVQLVRTVERDGRDAVDNVEQYRLCFSWHGWPPRLIGRGQSTWS